MLKYLFNSPIISEKKNILQPSIFLKTFSFNLESIILRTVSDNMKFSTFQNLKKGRLLET
jgi:hypothetical protein